MSVTSIQFIGLFVVMMNGGAGLQILLPHFPGTPYENHISVIQYSSNQVLSTTWPGTADCGPNNSFRCAPIDLETITFSGALDPQPNDLVGNIPHLSCCCPSMTDILSSYKDPGAADKLAAHIFVDHGVAEAIAASNTRIDTWVTMHSTDAAGITVTGDTGTGTFNIVFKAGAQFAILNSIPPDPATPPHFRAYYLMGTGSSDCTAVPTGGPPCTPTATACTTINSKATAVSTPAHSKKKNTPTPKPNISAAKSKPKPPDGTQKQKSRASTKPKMPGVTVMDTDVDCSNTHWP
ncbi:MAG TPA: hypothetical protein VNN08_23835 [Thermoanaerobaculia bacterium]|nr:hypothetical protein [Thermoanaerobaculia bacterium]